MLTSRLSSIFTHPVQLKHAQQFPNPTPAKPQSERIGENNCVANQQRLPAVLLEVVSNHFAGLLTNHVIQMKHFVNAARSSDPRCSNSLEATWLYTTQTQMSLFIALYIIFFAFKFAVKLHRKRAMTFLVRLLIQASDQRRIQLLRVIASHDQQTAGCVYYTIQRVEDTSQVQGIPAISRRVTMGTNRAPNSSTWCQIATRPKDSNGLSDFPECSRVSKHDHSFLWWRES